MFIVYFILFTITHACVCYDCSLISLDYGDYYYRTITSDIINHVYVDLYFANGIKHYLVDYPNLVLLTNLNTFYHYTDFYGENTICYNNNAYINPNLYQTSLSLVMICLDLNGCVGYFDFYVSYLTYEPTNEPTLIPTKEPTLIPTNEPTLIPTKEPTLIPTKEPTLIPTNEPTLIPTKEPTLIPTKEPTLIPTNEPTLIPTKEPTLIPTKEPTLIPTNKPTYKPVVINDPEININNYTNDSIICTIKTIIIFIISLNL